MAVDETLGSEAGSGRRPAWLHWVGPIVGVLIFVGALFVISQELHRVSWADLSASLAQTPGRALLGAFAALGVSLCAASCFDVLSLRVTGHSLSWRRTAITSAVAFALANAGAPGIALAGGVRYRSYQKEGMSGADVAVLSGVATLTSLLGGLVLICLAAAGAIQAIVLQAHMPGWIGVLIAFVTLKLLVVLVAVPRIGRLGRLLPSRTIRLGMIFASSVEWMAAAVLLYVLLPDPSWAGLLEYLPVFGRAGLFGAASGLPGGIGAFDAIILAVLGPKVGTAEVAAGLLLYRGIYVLAPLLAAGLIGLGLAVGGRGLSTGGRRSLAIGGDVWRELAPTVFALLAFVSGAITLLSAAMPADRAHLRFLAAFAPPGLIDLSHFLSSLAGVLLLFLAFGLRDRLRRAWTLNLVVLVVAVVTCLLKGFGLAEAGFLAVVAVLLAASRSAFDRRGDAGRVPISPGGVAAIVGVLIAAACLGLFAYRGVAYRDDLWWTFLIQADAPRFLRAAVGVATLALLLFGWRLTRPQARRPELPTAAEFKRVEAVLAVSEDVQPDAYLAFVGDKALMFTADDRSFVQYGVRGRTWIAMGEPVGPPEDRRAAIWAFRELCDRHAATAVFYAVRRQSLADFVDCGLTASKIGETALVDIADFTLDGKERAPLRHAINRGRREGVTFDVVPPEGFDAIEAELAALSREWLDLHHGVEKGFSLGRFDPAYLRRFPTAVLRKEGHIVAFANLWRTPDGRTLSVDLMRYGAEAPHNSMDILFLELLEWGRACGFAVFDLGMAPLSGLDTHRLSHSIVRIAGFVYHEGGGLYGFEGLRAFKQKFGPRWEAVYIATPTGWMLGPALADAALLSSGGLLGL